MDNLNGKVAVITGGASGMGLAFAHRFASEGARLVLADIEEPVLKNALIGLKEMGAEAIGVQCDVSKLDSMHDLAAEVDEVYGGADVLCLNAGVAAGQRTMLETTLADWQWVLGVNLWGIIHGIDAFLQGLVERDNGHIVITASVCGLTSFPSAGPYNTSKYAAVAIAETLYNELSAIESQVGVTALCPGFVNTQIIDSVRNRPEHLVDHAIDDKALGISADEQEIREEFLELFASQSHEPSVVAELVYKAILDRTFWVFTDEQHVESINRRHTEIRERSNPSEVSTMVEEFFGKIGEESIPNLTNEIKNG